MHDSAATVRLFPTLPWTRTLTPYAVFASQYSLDIRWQLLLHIQYNTFIYNIYGSASYLASNSGFFTFNLNLFLNTELIFRRKRIKAYMTRWNTKHVESKWSASTITSRIMPTLHIAATISYSRVATISYSRVACAQHWKTTLLL